MADDKRIPESAKSYGVTPSGKVYWNKRDAHGRFVRWDGSQGSAEYDAYFEAQYQAAERATRGNMVNLRGWDRGVSAERILRGLASLRFASEELRDWIEENGRPLSYSNFASQLNAA